MIGSEEKAKVTDGEPPAVWDDARGRVTAATWRWGVLLVLALGLSVLWLARRPEPSAPQMREAQDLPVIAVVPDFSLTERDGRSVTRSDLHGKVWVADFIFSNCAGPCPQLTLRMRGLQSAMPAEWDDVRLVSISLDPVADRPEVLQRYAQRYEADPRRWLFLTGEREKDVHDLVQKGFLQAVARAAPDTAIIHSTYFVVIDRKGRMRSVHEGLAPASTDAILRDIEALRSEPRP